MPFISYAKYYEDVMLWRALRDVEHGFYVDVGAADPEEFSVTRAFYDRGWSGINVEPLDEYFNRLVKDRPRDTNLKLAVGREAGLRTFHAIEGTGLSTFDPQIAARQQATDWQVRDTIVPMLTLAKVLEDCVQRTIHFLKIDVEGAEAEVVEGLDLDRVRPWIIIIEAREPSSTESTRDKWERLITGRGYGLAYFDGLNCFYVADEVAALKAQLAVPPNVSDDFVRFPEWGIRQEAAKLEQEVASLRGQAGGLEAVLQAEKEQTANLQTALRVAQEQTSKLRSSLRSEQAQKANLQRQLDHVLGRIQQLEAHLTVPSFDRAVGLALRRVHKTGDRLTGGGLRSLASRMQTTLFRRFTRNRRLMALGRATLRPFSKVATTIYELARKKDATAAASVASRAETLPSDDAATVAALPASARSAYLRLKAAMSDSDAWNRTQ